MFGINLNICLYRDYYALPEEMIAILAQHRAQTALFYERERSRWQIKWWDKVHRIYE